MAEARISTVKEIVEKSKYLVAISGSGMQRGCGHMSLRDQERAYDIEAEYGYSPEEMFSSAFYNTRTEPFYKFYKKEVLSQDMKPGPAYKTLARLEEKGVLKAIISREIYGLCAEAGCKNIIQPHGSVEKNHCPRCGREYSKQYLKDAKKVPICEKCMVPIRPGIRLYGEMIDNAVMTKVANEISKADVLLVLGVRLDQEFCENNLSYYTGDKLILITDRQEHGDENADYVIHGDLNELVPQLL
ncbi:MAG: Sir2 family NAD-dependent protein deacetylase [Eubacteriales bacterium]|nr:Sir2 family NAD-dependent protein deacetylase [Eubacteriales bacterium]